MAFGGMMAAGANRRSFRWLPDPDFHTQVNYEKKTPCLLDVGPELGPAQTIAPGAQFESCRAWVLPYENTERERCGLAVRKMYRTIAPWVTENPLMMHVRYADEKTVKAAIDQCAEVGFEMVILTFGSGFDLENEKPEVLELAQQYSEYARQKGIEIGSYSLLASRRIDDQNDVVMPEGQKPAFGNSPCLGSPWAEHYFERLYEFYKQSGFMLLEHDGSYPGDVCASESHPGHREPGRLALEPVAHHLVVLSLVPRTGHLPERARPLLPVRIEQDWHGISRSQLVIASRPTSHPHSPEYLRRNLGKDTQHGLDVCAVDRIPGGRRSGHH